MKRSDIEVFRTLHAEKLACPLGYPRNMRDTGEYLESVGRLDGVILLNWKEKTLERQAGLHREVKGAFLESFGKDRIILRV